MSALRLITALAVVVASAMLAAVVRRNAGRWGLVDLPNERSSHLDATPRGGGLGFVVTWTLAMAAYTWASGFDAYWATATLSALAVAGIGFADDLRSRSPRFRLLVHFAAACAVAFAATPLPQPFSPYFAVPGTVLIVLWTVAMVWAVNLFNFMDGIDGLAGVEALYCAIVFGLLAGHAGDAATFWAAAMLAAGLCGFLLLNWPPASIFMGDVGSGFLGATQACIALALATRSDVPAATLMLVPALFVTDATVTLLRRLGRREQVFQAHRSHAYQALARRWGHRRVVLSAVVANVMFLLPLVALSVAFPRHGWTLVALGYGVLTIVAVRVGAGAR